METNDHQHIESQPPCFRSNIFGTAATRFPDLDFFNIARYIFDDQGSSDGGANLSRVPYNQSNVTPYIHPFPYIENLTQYHDSLMNPQIQPSTHGFYNPLLYHQKFHSPSELQGVHLYHDSIPRHDVEGDISWAFSGTTVDNLDNLVKQKNADQHVSVQVPISLGSTYQLSSMTSFKSENATDKEVDRYYINASDEVKDNDKVEAAPEKSYSNTLKAIKAERRKERNRLLARKTRLRKKFYYEALQEQVKDLRKQNLDLKHILKEKLGNDRGQEIIRSCLKETDEIFASDQSPANINLEASDFKLMKFMLKAQQTFIITNPKLPDNPITYASHSFLEMTGYSREEVIGRNCRFLQGPDTDSKTVDKIRDSIKDGKDISVRVRNYKKDGTPFLNQLFIAALRDDSNNIVSYVGVQSHIPDFLFLQEDFESSNELNSTRMLSSSSMGPDVAVAVEDL